MCLCREVNAGPSTLIQQFSYQEVNEMNVVNGILATLIYNYLLITPWSSLIWLEIKQLLEFSRTSNLLQIIFKKSISYPIAYNKSL